MVKFLKLTDAAALQKTAKYTFYRPSERVMSKLKKGNLVKLVFEITGLESNDLLAMLPSAERMWVIITERNGDKFKGTLDNNPYKIQDLKAGDIVEFETKHIIQSDIEEMEFDIVEKYSAFSAENKKWKNASTIQSVTKTSIHDQPQRKLVTAGQTADISWVNERATYRIKTGVVVPP